MLFLLAAAVAANRHLDLHRSAVVVVAYCIRKDTRVSPVRECKFGCILGRVCFFVPIFHHLLIAATTMEKFEKCERRRNAAVGDVDRAVFSAAPLF